MRLIDADALIHDIKHCLWDWKHLDGISAVIVLRQTISDIKNQPTVEAEPVRHGKWLTPRGHENARCCSVCKCIYHKDSVQFYEYCPNCGAKMERKNDGI